MTWYTIIPSDNLSKLFIVCVTYIGAGKKLEMVDTDQDLMHHEHIKHYDLFCDDVVYLWFEYSYALIITLCFIFHFKKKKKICQENKQ